MAELYTLPDGWEWKKLDDVTTELSSKTQALQCHEKPYLSLENIESNTGNIINFLTVKESNIIGTCSNFNSNSVIYSKLRPYLNKVATPNFDGVGTTELIVFLPKENLDKYYLAHFLRSGSIVAKIDASSYGAKMPRASSKFLRALDFPLPPLSEQQRIVAKLDLLFAKIDKSIELHQKNRDEADAFMGSVLNEVFGELEEKYEKKKINEVVKEGGKTISALDYPDLIYFSLEDIEAHSGKILKYQTVSEANVKGTAVRFDTECVLYSKLRPYLNKVTISKSDGCSTTELVVLRPKENLDKYYLASFLRSPNVVNFLHNDSMGAKMPRTNMKTFRAMGLPLPPHPIQQKVVHYLDSVSEKMEKVKTIQNEKMERLKALKASILDRAFRGEL